MPFANLMYAKFLEKKNMKTSTPMNNKYTICLSKMESFSPIKKGSCESGKPGHGSNKNNAQKDVGSVEKHEILCKSSANAINKSQDKISLFDGFVELQNNVEKVSTIDDIDAKPNGKHTKEPVISNSEEEDAIFEDRRESINKRKQTEKKLNRNERKIEAETNTMNSFSDIQNTGATNDSLNRRIISPKITVETNKAPTLKRKRKKSETPAEAKENRKLSSKKHKLIDSAESNPDSSSELDKMTLRKSSKECRVKITSKDEDLLRRSNRKRCRVLEYWNGERMETDRFHPLGLGEVIENGKIISVRRRKIVRGDRKVDTKKKVIGASIEEPKTSFTNKKKIEKKSSILKLKRNTITSKANVRFSNFGTGTTIHGPTNIDNIKPDWINNFGEMQSRTKQLLASENCVVCPGLDTATGCISSALIEMRPKFMTQGEASNFQHSIFCMMVGKVRVTINDESEVLENFGHFTVPCGRSYHIENIGSRNAVLSFFKIDCNCANR